MTEEATSKHTDSAYSQPSIFRIALQSVSKQHSRKTQTNSPGWTRSSTVFPNHSLDVFMHIASFIRNLCKTGESPKFRSEATKRSMKFPKQFLG